MDTHTGPPKLGKRSFVDADISEMSVAEETEEDMPVKKKLRIKLIDIFNRASICPPDDHMNVYLRIKPLTKEEIMNGSEQSCLVVDKNSVTATAPEHSHNYKSTMRGVTKSSHVFTFSRIFEDTTSQAAFFNETMLDMTRDFIEGHNSLVFTYGVTSSGKTYTIQGEPQDAGILPRCLDVLFNSISGKQMTNISLKPRLFTDVVKLTPEEIAAERKIKDRTFRMSIDEDTTFMTLLGDGSLSDTAASSSSGCQDDSLPEVEHRVREVLKVDVEDQGAIRFGVWVSFAEIYNEQIFDLLEPLPPKKNARRPVLKISEDKNGSPYVKGLKEIHVESADEAYRLLTIGQRNLQTACTRLNHCSSRSHCIFNIKIVRVVDKDDPHVARVSMLSLCDLAGSERSSKTQATGERLKEAGNINTSLMTLGRCVETLRYNQIHKDQQRMVPFRDSKLTRLFQNFFSGSGRAAMIVNVSQCASVFDDTLQVFKFSAIAKQVRTVENPPEIIKPKKKNLPPIPRDSIAWETEASSKIEQTVKEAQSKPIPEDDDEEIVDEWIDKRDSESVQKTVQASRTFKKMKAVVKELKSDNDRLIQMMEEEIVESSNLESRVRKEVTQVMMKQLVRVEETYSKLLKESSADALESSDERVRGIMEVYERRIERIQRKVDEEDEWVSSLLYYQEQVKVKERDAKIAEIQKDLQSLKTQLETVKKQDSNTSVNIENTVLIETLSQQLQEAREASKLKDEKIEDLDSLITEAGEVYNKNITEIEALKQDLLERSKALEQQMAKGEQLEQSLSCEVANSSKLEQKIKDGESAHMLALEEVQSRLLSKDTTIRSLEEECRQMQDEIERLQDQMSQMDENSKRCDEDLSENKNNSGSVKPSVEQREEEISASDKTEAEQNETKRQFQKQVEQFKFQEEKLQKQLETMEKELKSQTESNNELEKEVEIMKNSNTKLQAELEDMSEKQIESTASIEALNTKVESLKQELAAMKSSCEQSMEKLLSEKEDLSKEISSLKEENVRLVGENSALKVDNSAKVDVQKTNEELALKEQILEMNSSALETGKNRGVFKETTNITEIVEQMERGSRPRVTSTEMCDSSDTEITFKSQVPPTPKTPEATRSEMAMKLKDWELANAALRSKLKREEEDFFKREQALIHGYTAQIESLRYELAKTKSKELPLRTKSLRGKRKANNQQLDSSVSSTISESCDVPDCETSHMANEASSNLKTAFDVLSCELNSVQIQLASLMSTYKKLQMENKSCNQTNSFIQDVVLGTSKFQSQPQGVFRSEDQMTDSVLLFEMTEHQIKAEEMKIRIQDQEAEIKTLRETLSKEKTLRDELESKIQILNKANSQLQTENTQSEKTKSDVIQELHQQLEDVEQVLKKRQKEEMAVCQVKAEEMKARLQSQEVEIKTMRETLSKEKMLRDELESKINDLDKCNLQLKTENEEMVEHQLKAEERKARLQSQEAEIKTMHETLSKEKMLRDELESKINDLDKYNSQLKSENEEMAEHQVKAEEMKARLQSQETEIKTMYETLNNEKMLRGDLESKITTLDETNSLLKTKHSQHENTKSEVIQELRQRLENAEQQLQKKQEEVEKLAQDMQENGAEVSQKLITLEKQKRAAQRKAAEADENKQEMDRIKEQLQEQLENRKKQSEMASTLLATKDKELDELRTEMAQLSASKDNEIEELTAKISKTRTDSQELMNKNTEITTLKKSLEEEKVQKQKTKKDLQEVCDKLEELKTYVKVSEDTMEQQDKVIVFQDGQITELKAEMDTLTQDKDKLDRVITRKELELANVNEQMAKLQEEAKLLQGTERRAWEFERKEHEIEKLNEQRVRELEEKRQVEVELKVLKKQMKDECDEIKQKSAQMKDECSELKQKTTTLQEELSALKLKLEDKDKELQKINAALTSANETIQRKEQDVTKQEQLNKRNREEMENWKKEKDECVAELKKTYVTLCTEKQQLAQEVQQLKKDNADLAQNVNNITSVKDSVIAELRKSNNTLSIQMASVQGISPPPKIDTPEQGFHRPVQLQDDIDISGHKEIDVTPSAAVKKGRRKGSSRGASTSVDPPEVLTPVQRSLRTIDEQNENSPSSSESSNKAKRSVSSVSNRMTDFAHEVLNTLSPLTRSARRTQEKENKSEKDSKKKKKTSTLAPFNIASFVATDEQSAAENLARRSTRLRNKSTKHSVV